MAKFAVLITGGKQYRVTEGQTLKVEKIEKAPGEHVVFDKVLMVTVDDATQVGAPDVAGARVTAEIVGHGRGEKIRIVKFRRRKHHMKQMGHRQWYTELKVAEITA